MDDVEEEGIMGMWNRMTTLLKANLNHVVKGAEDPERILDQLLLDMQDQLVKAKSQVATVIAQEKRLKKQLNGEQEKAKGWEKKAMMAIRANRDDLAKEALRRKAEHDSLAEGYMAQWEAQKASADKLKEQLRSLDAKIADARRRKQRLVARKRHVEAQQTMQKTLSSISKNNPASRFDAFEKQIDEEQARLEAAREVDEATSGSTLEAKFDALGHDAETEDALAALKSKMGANGVHVSFEKEEEEEVRYEHAMHVGA